MEPSLEKFVTLIESLYEPNNIDVIPIQQQLQVIQKTNLGIQYSDSLIAGAYSTNCKYFAVLTYTIHLNNGAIQIDDELFQKMMIQLNQLVQQNATIVIKKMFQNFAIVYKKIPYSLHRFSHLDRALFFAFITIFIEEVGKYEDVELHQNVRDNVYPIVKDLLLQDMQMDVMLSLFQYVSKVQATTGIRYELTDLFSILVQTFNVDKFDFFIELFEENPLMMNYQLRAQFEQLLWDYEVTSLDLDGLENFATLFIAFLQIDTLQLVQRLFKDQAKLKHLLRLTNVPLSPSEEQISYKFIQFWHDLLDVFTDDLLTLKENLEWPTIDSNSKQTFHQVSMVYFKKCEQFDNSKELGNYRMDVTELFEGLYQILGMDLFNGLVGTVLNSQDCNEIETSLFLLASLCSNFNEGSDQLTNSINELFKADFLAKMQTLTVDKPKWLNKSTIRFLGEVQFYYKLHPQPLLSVISFLFNSLKSAPDQQLLISRTIMAICGSCRIDLLPNIAQFEPILEEMIINPEIDSYIREKVIHSVCCIVQSIPSPVEQERYCFVILQMIGNTVQPYLNRVLNEVEVRYVVSLMSSLYEMGKGLQLPDTFDESPEFNTFKQFWEMNNRIHITLNSLICAIVFENEQLRRESLLLDKALGCYKLGLLEPFGPFALGNTNILQFCFELSQKTVLSKSLPGIMELLVAVLNNGLKDNSISDDQISWILNEFVELKYVEHISDDPDLLQLCVHLFSSITTGRPKYWLSHMDKLGDSVRLSVELLGSKEKFVIKSVSKFWCGFLSPRKFSNDEELQQWRRLIETDVGGLLTFETFKGLFNTTRSNIDQFSAIIVLLVSKFQLQFKIWALEALQKLGVGDYELVVKKLLITRGTSRKCNELVKTLWKEVNGLTWS